MSALLPMLLSKIAGSGGGAGGAGGGPGGPGTGPSGSPSDDMASGAFGSALSSARQADPAALGQTISSVKQQILELINQTWMTNAGVGSDTSKPRRGL